MSNLNSSQKKLYVRTAFFVLPAVILMFLFIVGPIIMTFYFSFTDISLTGEHATNYNFVGFENFKRLFSDPSFGGSVVKTILFLIGSALVGQQVLGFIVALLMKNRAPSFRRLTGILILAGWITPEIVVAFIWYAFLGDDGTMNTILSWFGVKPVAWLFKFPMVSVIIANIWHGTAFSMLIYQAALDDVPTEVEESARIDGASAWQRLWRVILPIIKGSALTNMVLVTLQTLGVFTLIYALTGGGPGSKTTILPVFMYDKAFVDYQIGYGTAISLIILLIGIIASLVYVRMLKVDL